MPSKLFSYVYVGVNWADFTNIVCITYTNTLNRNIIYFYLDPIANLSKLMLFFFVVPFFLVFVFIAYVVLYFMKILLLYIYLYVTVLFAFFFCILHCKLLCSLYAAFYFPFTDCEYFIIILYNIYLCFAVVVV